MQSPAQLPGGALPCGRTPREGDPLGHFRTPPCSLREEGTPVQPLLGLRVDGNKASGHRPAATLRSLPPPSHSGAEPLIPELSGQHEDQTAICVDHLRDS